MTAELLKDLVKELRATHDFHGVMPEGVLRWSIRNGIRPRSGSRLCHAIADQAQVDSAGVHAYLEGGRRGRLAKQDRLDRELPGEAINLTYDQNLSWPSKCGCVAV